MQKNNIKYINPTKEAEDKWRKRVTELNDATLFPGTSSWYMGANVPGKPREQLNYLGGLPKYIEEISSVLDEGLTGFVKVK